MTKRQLNTEETQICQKQIGKLIEEAMNLQYLEKYTRLLVEEGLEYSYNKQKKEYTEQLKTIQSDLKNVKDRIEILQNQITNGVETKEQNEEIQTLA